MTRKSQIAIEYGYRIHQKAPNTWIFWIDAESDNTIEQSYREIANALMLHGEANVFNLVCNWLRNEANGNWVMLLDNADNKNVLCSHSKQNASLGDSKQLKEYIPQSMNGSVLVTSRSRDAAFEITCNYKNIKTIEPMEKEEGLSLLRSYLADAHQEEDMEMLLEAVDHIPLAISHAGSYITKRGMPIKSYLQELHKESGKEVSLLEDDIAQLRREAKRGNSVVKTWIITFDHIRQTTPSAARLLSLMCHFARQSIPKEILQGNYDEQPSPVAKRKSWWKRRFRTRRKKEEQPIPMASGAPPRTVGDDLLTLQDFSLIKKNNGGEEFSMHALVQLTTKRWLAQNKELTFWNHRFIIILEDYLSRKGYKNFLTCENLFQHAAAAISEQPCHTLREPSVAWASLAMKVASYCNSKAALEEEQIFYGAAACVYAKTLGLDAPDTLRCALKQAHALLSMKRIAESEDAFRAVLRIQQKSLGPEHLDTLDTMEIIAETMLRQARSAEAETLYTQISEIRCRKYGISHPKTITSMSSRLSALVRNNQGVEAFAMWKKMFSTPSTPCDPRSVDQLGYIGSVLAMKGQTLDAERCYREFLVQRERILAAAKQNDENYLRVAEAKISLASVLVTQEKYCEAEPLLYEALEACKSPAMDRFQTADLDEFEITWLLTLTLTHLDKLDKAEEVARLNLSNHYQSGSSKSYRAWEASWALGGVLERKMNLTEAMQLYKKAYEGAVKDLGADHADTKTYDRDYKALEQKVCRESNLVSEQKAKSDCCNGTLERNRHDKFANSGTDDSHH